MMRVPQTCSPTIGRLDNNNVTMPFDKQNNTIKGRSHVPTLSNSAKATKSPLTPRIVGSSPPLTSSSFKRGPLAESETTPKGHTKEDISTPVKAFLSSNITPRSGLRKARVDSAPTTPSGTPNGTPNSSRPTSMADAPQHLTTAIVGPGLGIIGVGNGSGRRPRSIISEGNNSDLSYMKGSPDSAGYNGYGRLAASPESSPMFFYASDARSSVSSQGPSLDSNPQRKPPSLVIANGFEGGERLKISPHRANTVSPQEESKAKFFHVDETTDSRKDSPKLTKPISHLPGASSPRVATFSPQNKPNIKRPPSPLKEAPIVRSTSLKKPAPRSYTPLVHNPAVHQIEPVSPSEQRAIQTGLGRRSSLSSPAARRVSHAKANSVSSLESTPTRRRSLRLPDTPAPSMRTIPSKASSETSPTEASPEEASTNGVTIAKGDPGSVSLPQSPTKALRGQSKLQQMNELAANARRERKVLDLEISNSSLLAINRTLEREMRKQNAELRRYRRLSRSGRLSMATSMRSISGGGLSMLSETENGSEISEFPEEDYGDEISDDESLLEDGSLSPNTYAEHDARLRAKDEKRLQLDLSKHQELLLDSQRLNQSIIRCLGWTEDLIKEGQKALNYHVRVSDVEVGGRVLTPDEVDAGISHRRGLLSPAHEPGNPMGEDLHLETAALVNELLPTEGPETEPLEKDPLQPVHIEESKDDGANSVEPPQTPGPRGSGGAVLGLGLGTYLHGLSETLGI